MLKRMTKTSIRCFRTMLLLLCGLALPALALAAQTVPDELAPMQEFRGAIDPDGAA